MRKRVSCLSIVLLLLCTLLVDAAHGGEKDIVIAAMKDELARSMAKLRLDDMEKPYYIEYCIVDNREWHIEASFGSLTRCDERHQRYLKVGLRVGSYQLDNTGFLSRANMFAAVAAPIRDVSLEDDYDVLRHEIWLATDDAYKEALEQLASKKAFIKNQVQTEEIPDFSREKSTQLIARRKIMKPDQERWETIVKELSALFRRFPAIHESAVEFQVKIDHKYFINSEGTLVRQPETVVSLVAHASTQAADGMELSHHIPFYAASSDALPDEKQLADGVREMAQELTALAAAPVLEEYIGPVLFTRQASAELFAQVLAPHLCGDRPPLTEEPRLAEMVFSSKLPPRLERRILPRTISIVDDPTRTHFEKEPLLGSYAVDDQGVAAHPVKLVEAGILKTLLMSRRPRKEIVNSNGHARAGINARAGAQVANLLITSGNGLTDRQMKDELIRLCKEEGLAYGLIIKSVDNPAITGTGSFRPSLFLSSRQTSPQLTAPVMMVRVRVEDGREELIRGISLSEIDLSHLKDIAAVGSDYFVHHCLLPGFGRVYSFFAFGSRGGNLEIPASIAAPSVLFEELEFKKSKEALKNPPLLKHPFFTR